MIDIQISGGRERNELRTAACKGGIHPSVENRADGERLDNNIIKRPSLVFSRIDKWLRNRGEIGDSITSFLISQSVKKRSTPEQKKK